MNVSPLLNPDCIRGGTLSGTPGAWRFRRFPSGCDALAANVYMADCAAGIRIRFRTDARKVVIRGIVAANQYHREHAAWNARIDGDTLLTLDMPDLKTGSSFLFEIELAGPPSAHRVEIFPTAHLPVEIRRLEAMDASFAEPCPPEPDGEQLLFLGDSITQGYFSDPALSWASLVTDALHADALNLAIGGACMPNGLPKKVREIPWTRCFVAYGVNDAAQNLDPDYFRDSAEKTLRDLTQSHPGRPVELISPVYWPNGEFTDNGELLARFRLILRSLADAYPAVRFHDGESLMPKDRTLFFDGVHPNNEGMGIYAGSLLKQLGSF